MSRMSQTLNKNTTKKFVKKDNAAESLIAKHLANAAAALIDEVQKTADEIEEAIAQESVEDAVKRTCTELRDGADAELKDEFVNHPKHYAGKKFEVIDIIEDYSLNFNLGNSLKYLLRAGHKDDYVQDLKKAIWYLNREIETYNSNKGL